jgi:hypothetical protein
VKLEVAKLNKTFIILDVEGLLNEELNKVGQADWASCAHHAVSLQEDDYTKKVHVTKF